MGYHISLNLKNDEAYQLARELSELTGKSMTAAVIEALRERVEQLKQAPKPESEEEFVARILAIGRDAAAHMTEEERSANYDDLLYNELGLPRDC